jgi:xylulokinase
MHSPEEGSLELDPREVLAGVREVLQAVCAETANDPVRSLGISTLGEAAVPVDENFEMLGNAIIGFDSRGQEQKEVFERKISNEEIFARTGHGINAYHTIFKVMWWRDHQPEVFRQMKYFLTFSDFVIAKLGLEPRIDHSNAARTLGFDIQKREWSKPILEAAGLDNVFAKPIAPGDVAGIVGPNDFGLPEGCVVAGGLHDQPAGILGAGICPGESMLATGTVVCLGVRLDSPPEPGPMIANNLCYYPTFGADQWVALAWNFTGGILLRWFRDQLASAECADAAKRGVDPYEVICGNLPEDPTGLLVLPHFTTAGTPSFDARALGAILGLRLTTTRQEIAKAVLEGVAYEIQLNAELLANSGIKIERYKAIGGAAKSPVWLQIYADILNRPVVQLEVTEGASLGVALMGAYGAGIHKSQSDINGVIERQTREGLVFEPDEARAARYCERGAIYKDFYPTTRDMTHRIFDLLKSESGVE